MKDIHSQKYGSAELKRTVVSHSALVGSVCSSVGMTDLIFTSLKVHTGLRFPGIFFLLNYSIWTCMWGTLSSWTSVSSLKEGSMMQMVNGRGLQQSNTYSCWHIRAGKCYQTKNKGKKYCKQKAIYSWFIIYTNFYGIWHLEVLKCSANKSKYHHRLISACYGPLLGSLNAQDKNE